MATALPRYYPAEDPAYAGIMAEHCWRVYDRTGGRESILLDEDTAEREAYRLNRDRYRKFASEEHAEQAADDAAPFWGEEL